jgi:iron complex outermembrane receptor protein
MNVSKTLRWSAFTAPLSALFMAAPAVMMPLAGWSQTVEEVTVTARRRDENAQDIPVAVASFDADFLEKQGINNTKDILKLVPGVTFDQSFSSNDTRISIRGINSSRGRTSVAVLVDGIDVSGESVTVGGGSSLLNTSLLDLERVEIVKGPQSALYGRSAFAGAINYITKKPSLDKTDITISGDYGTDDTYNMKGTISGPVIPGVLALGFTAASSQSDGYYSNKVNGQDLNGYDNKGLRFSALWTPSDTLEIEPSISYQDNQADPRAVYKVADANTFYDVNGTQLPSSTTAATAPPNGYGNWLGTVGNGHESKVRFSNSTVENRKFTGSEDKQWLAALKVGWDLGSTTLRSKTSYLHNESEINEDVDFQDGLGTFIPDPFGPGSSSNFSIANEFFDDTDTNQFNQEFTLESNDWDRGSWLVGAQYYHEDVDNKDNSLGWYNDFDNLNALGFFCGSPYDPNFGGPFPCNSEQAASNTQGTKTISRDTDSYSLFAQLSYDLTDKLTATVEGRWIKDEIEVKTNTKFSRVNQYFFALNEKGNFKDDTNTREFNPRFALDYKMTDDMMFYGSVARGTKPGGYGTAQFARPELSELDPEKLWAYEVGTKTEWFDNTLRANVALFFNDYDDRQIGVTVDDPEAAGFPAAGIVNAGTSQTQGMEVDLQWLATDYLTLGLGYALISAEWTDYDYRDIRAEAGRSVTAKDRSICDSNGDCDGADVAGVPDNSVMLMSDYRRPLGGTGMDLFVNANAVWEDKRALNDAKKTAYVDSHWTVDTQVGVEAERWSAMLFVTNLFDDDTVAWAQGQQPDFRDGNWNNGQPRDDAVFGFLPDPRIVGMRASYKFGN